VVTGSNKQWANSLVSARNKVNAQSKARGLMITAGAKLRIVRDHKRLVTALQLVVVRQKELVAKLQQR
jgi:hypothetical protein